MKNLFFIKEPFIINLEDIAFWLKTRKNDLKETLNNSYSKDIDYIILRVNPQTIKNKQYNSSSIHKKEIFLKIPTINKKHFEECLKGVLYDYRYKDRKDFFKVIPDKILSAVKKCKVIIKEFKNDQADKQAGGKQKILSIDDPDYDNKMNISIKETISNYTDNILWNLFEPITDAFYQGKKISIKMLNNIALPMTLNNKLLILPIHRESEIYINLELKTKEYTYKQLFKILYNFYNKTEVNIKMLSKITNDFYDYKKEALKKIKNQEKVFILFLIGNMCRFEKVYQVSNFEHIFTIFLGS